MKVQGPCFQSSSDIECIFGDQEVKAVYISKLLVICISPMLNPPGVVDFALLVDRRVYFGPTFTTRKLCISSNFETTMIHSYIPIPCSVSCEGSQCGHYH